MAKIWNTCNRITIWKPADQLVSKLGEVEQIILFTEPLDRPVGFGRNTTLWAVSQSDNLGSILGHKSLVCSAVPDIHHNINSIFKRIVWFRRQKFIPALVFAFINKSIRLKSFLWKVTDILNGFYKSMMIPTQNCCTVVLWRTSVVLMKSLWLIWHSSRTCRKASEIWSQWDEGSVLAASAAVWIFKPCSSVPVENMTGSLPCNRRNLAAASANTAVYTWPMCGAILQSW